MDRNARQGKGREDLNDTEPTSLEHTVQQHGPHILPQCTRNTCKTNHAPGRETSLGPLKKIGIIYSVFFNHNGRKLKINNRNNFEKLTNLWKLNNTTLNQCVTEEKGKLENTLR